MFREFKSGQYVIALDKYQKALRYLDVHPVLPDDASAEIVEGYRALYVKQRSTSTNVRRFPLLTNAALSALKASPPAGHLAVTLATRALALSPLSDAEKAKALYRRALGKVVTKDDEEAEKDLQQALILAPGDGGVIKALREVEARRNDKKEREKRAYAKMFA